MRVKKKLFLVVLVFIIVILGSVILDDIAVQATWIAEYKDDIVGGPEDYFNAVVRLVEHPELITTMSKNSIRISKSFYSEEVVSKLINILGDNGGL